MPAFRPFTKDGYQFVASIWRDTYDHAFKVLPPDETDRELLGILCPAFPGYYEERIDRLLEQSASWQHINHKRVLPCYTAGSLFWSSDRSNRAYFVTDYYDEGDLLGDKLATDNKPKLNVLVQSMIDCAVGLQALHQAGIAHGCVNPFTILIGADGRGRLLNPMEGRVRAEMSAVNSMGESNWDFTFIAPEALESKTGIDVRSDLFSLVSVLYFLLTGGKPFTSNSAFGLSPELLAGLLPDDPKTHGAKNVERNLELVLAKGLRVVLAERYQHPGELLQDLQAVLQGGEPPFAARDLLGKPLWAGQAPVSPMAVTALPDTAGPAAEIVQATQTVESTTSQYQETRTRRSVQRGSTTAVVERSRRRSRSPSSDAFNLDSEQIQRSRARRRSRQTADENLPLAEEPRRRPKVNNTMPIIILVIVMLLGLVGGGLVIFFMQ